MNGEPALVEVFYGGPFDGRRVPFASSDFHPEKGVVDPDSGAFYARAVDLDGHGERAWKLSERDRFAAGGKGAGDLAGRAPVGLSTMSVKASSKDAPVTLGQLRALGERAAEQGFPDDTPLRALVFMRGTVKALEVRAE